MATIEDLMTIIAGYGDWRTYGEWLDPGDDDARDPTDETELALIREALADFAADHYLQGAADEREMNAPSYPIGEN